MNKYKRNRNFLNYIGLTSIIFASILSFFHLADKVYIFFFAKLTFSISLYFIFYILFEDENAEKLKYSFWTHLLVYLFCAIILYFLDFNPIKR